MDPRGVRRKGGSMRREKERPVSRSTADVGVLREVGLALRAHRRERGESQRAYAKARRLSRELIARVEVNAGMTSLSGIVSMLDGTGYELAVVPVGVDRPRPAWDDTDLQARTRAGSRFPPHREVRSTDGPLWWWYHEYLGSRGFGPVPGWTAEGFTPPEGTRYGREPRPTEDGKPRWPR